MKELETLKELKDYELLYSEKRSALFGLLRYEVNYYLYKGLFYNVMISWCDKGQATSWVATYGTGDTWEFFETLGYVYFGKSKHTAIEKTKDILGRVKGNFKI